MENKNTFCLNEKLCTDKNGEIFNRNDKNTWLAYLLFSYPSSDIFSVDNADTDSCGVDPRYSFCYPDTGMSNFALQNVWKSSCSLNMLKTKDKLKNIKTSWPLILISIVIWISFLPYPSLLLVRNYISMNIDSTHNTVA